MKHLLTCFVSLLSFTTYAQDTPAQISRELAALIDVPALISETEQDLTITGSTIYFDKIIKISNNQNSAITYLYINTQTGETGTRTGKPEVIGEGWIDISDEKFTLTYYKPSAGIITTFYNKKRNGVLKHYFSTLNTAVSPVTFPAFEPTTVFKAGSSKNVLSQGFSATPYKASGANAPMLYLCGGPTPPRLLLKRFIGFAGIGYVKTDRGILMVTEMRSAQGSFKAEQWQQLENMTDNSIDVSHFQSEEGEMYTSVEQKLNKELATLDRRQPSGGCAEWETQLIEFKKQRNRQQQIDMQGARNGNLITDTAALLSLGNTMSPERQVEEILLGIELSLCRLDERERKLSENDDRERARIVASRACLIENRQKLSALLTALQNMRPASSSARDRIRLQGDKQRVLLVELKQLKKCNS